MPHLRELNNHNTAKKNGYFLGHSNNFATLSLSLSLSLSYALTASPPHLIIYAPVRVNIRLSMQKAMGSRYVFMPCRLLKRPFLQRKYN